MFGGVIMSEFRSSQANEGGQLFMYDFDLPNLLHLDISNYYDYNKESCKSLYACHSLSQDTDQKGCSKTSS